MSRTGRVFTLSAALMTAMLSSCGGGNKKPVAATAQYADGFSVSDVFSSDMIVQRGENIRIWGWADESQNGRGIRRLHGNDGRRRYLGRGVGACFPAGRRARCRCRSRYAYLHRQDRNGFLGRSCRRRLHRHRTVELRVYR